MSATEGALRLRVLAVLYLKYFVVKAAEISSWQMISGRNELQGRKSEVFVTILKFPLAEYFAAFRECETSAFRKLIFAKKGFVC